MDPLWTLDELKDVLEIDSPLTGEIKGISIDSREVKQGDLFIPLRGDTHDAHKFVGQALQNGAVAALVDHIPNDVPLTPKILQVKDTFKAMETLAHHARARSRARIIAITGSFGKTTTKEMLNLILSDQGPTTANVKSFNNHWGLPLSLCRLPQQDTYGIFEVGMNHSGEISKLVQILKPTVSLITEIGEVHGGNFSGIEGIIQAKCEVFENNAPGSIAVLNRDSASFNTQLKSAQNQGIETFLTFGKHPSADFKLHTLEEDFMSQRVTFLHKGKSYTFTLGTTGDHWALNALAAITTAHAVGADITQAAHSMENFQLLPGRGKRYTLPLPSGGHFMIIDESYNSNPEALRKALHTLNTLTPTQGGRRIAVLGEMRELGSETHQIHKALATDLETCHVEKVYTSGKDIEPLFEALPSEQRGLHALDVSPLFDELIKDIQPGDIILVKGSRGGGQTPRMQEVVDRLIAEVS